MPERTRVQDLLTRRHRLVRDTAFEWDGAQAARNWRDHGISFAMDREAFDDAFAIEWIDIRHAAGEQRLGMLGMVENRLLFVVYTLRGERIRIISARKAEPQERRRYHNANRKA